MRPPRLRFTVRWLMLLVAVVALSLGTWVGVQSQRRGEFYRAVAQQFTAQAARERQAEQTLRAKAREQAVAARQSVDRALGLSGTLASSPQRELDPGIFGGQANRDSSDRLIVERARFEMEYARTAGMMARHYLDQANNLKQRAQHSSELAAKYDQATHHPLRPVAPDPPAPK